MSGISRFATAANNQFNQIGAYVCDQVTKFPKANQERQLSTIMKVVAAAAVIYIVGVKVAICLAAGAFFYATYCKMNEDKPLQDLADFFNKLFA